MSGEMHAGNTRRGMRLQYAHARLARARPMSHTQTHTDTHLYTYTHTPSVCKVKQDGM